MIKRIFFFLLTILVLPLAAQMPESLFREKGELRIRFILPPGLDQRVLSKMVSIDRIRADTVFANASLPEYRKLLQAGILPDLVPAPSGPGKQKMQGAVKGSLAWDSYPTYEGYLALMAGWASSYPAICRLDTIGTSVNGRLILALKLSDSVHKEEAEPQVFYASSIHGDEITGYGLMLHLIDTLLSSYGKSAANTRLLDSLEIWINPLANPDGTYYSGNSSVINSTRRNANGADLNRNYPDPEDGEHPDGREWQPENIAMMNFMKGKRFCLSANFHDGAEVMNYPWDTWYARHPDDAWFQFISYLFADSSRHYGPPGYFQDVTSTGVSNGYDWYTISGGRQDYTTYFLRGREITIEISSYFELPSSLLPAFWNYNYRSLLNYLEQGMYGIHGFVLDSTDGHPLRAQITVLGHDQASAHTEVYTDSVSGYFVRLLEQGSWDLLISAEGYPNDTLRAVEVKNFHTTSLRHFLSKGPTQASAELYGKVEHLNLWPVPANQFLNWSVNEGNGKACRVKITDLSGRTVWEQIVPARSGAFSGIIETSNLPSGAYVFELSQGRGFSSSRLFSLIHQ